MVPLDDQAHDPRPAAPVRRLLLLALMCLVLGGLGGVFAATATRPAKAAARFIPPREPAFDFSLRNQDGKRVSLADARGKVVIMTFLYSTCRDLCPAQAADIVSAVTMVGSKNVMVYGISVDPVGDTQARVRRWLGVRGLTGGNVQFLIGSRDELRPVWIHYGITPVNATRAEAEASAKTADALFSAKHASDYKPPHRTGEPPAAEDPNPDTSDLAYRGHARHAEGWDFEHSAYVMLVDKHGTQRLGIPFEALDPPSLAQDIRGLLAEH